MGTTPPPLIIKILKIWFLHAREDQKIALGQISMNLGPQIADISVDNRRANFNTGPYRDPPWKIQILRIIISKIGLCHVLSRPKLVLEPKWPLDFWWLRKTITDRQTRFMFYKYRLHINNEGKLTCILHTWLISPLAHCSSYRGVFSYQILHVILDDVRNNKAACQH